MDLDRQVMLHVDAAGKQLALVVTLFQTRGDLSVLPGSEPMRALAATLDAAAHALRARAGQIDEGVIG